MDQKFKVNSVCRDVVKKEQVMEWRIAGCNEASSYLIDPFSEDAPPAHIIRSTEGVIDGKKWSAEAYVERISIQESDEMKHNVRLKFFVNDDGKCPNNCYQFEVEYDDFSERSWYLRNSSGSGRVLKSSENDPLLQTGFGIKRWKPKNNWDSLGNPVENEDEFTLTIWCMKLSFDVDTELEVEKSLLDDTDLENGFEKVDITAASSEISVLQNEATDEETEANRDRDEAELIGASIATIVNKVIDVINSEAEAAMNEMIETQIEEDSYEYEGPYADAFDPVEDQVEEPEEQQTEDKPAEEPFEPTVEGSEPQQNAAAEAIRSSSPSGSETYEKISNNSTASRWTDDSSDDEEEFTPDQKSANAHVVKRIRKIYLVKMKQIAETSSRLLVTAARFNFAELLSESCRSLGAQLTSKNFVEIWQIAKELKAEELKEMVVKYVVDNRERLPYDESMTSDLMLEVVRAIG